MQYLAIRLTHPDNVYDPAWDSLYIDKITQVLSQIGTVEKATYGHEISLKTKKHHFHWHIQLEPLKGVKQKKGISNYVKRHLKEKHDLDLPKGQGYSIKQVTPQPKLLTNPDDPDEDPDYDPIWRWHGYVFKDLKHFEDMVMVHQQGFTTQQLRDMWAAARRERQKAIENFRKYENKLNNDKQSRKLLWDWLDKNLPEDLLDKGKCNELYPNPHRLVSERIVQYNIEYNDFRIPMDLKRRSVSYLAYRGCLPSILANIIL